MSFTPPTSQASTIVAHAKARTRQGASSPAAAFGETVLYEALHDINEWFCYWTFNPENGGIMPFSFLRREKLFSAQSETALNGAVAAGADSLVVDDGTIFSSPEPSSSEPGGLWIDNGEGDYDFITFEERSTHTLSSLTTVDIAHADAEVVGKIYLLPSDYGRPRVLKLSESQHLDWIDGEFESIPPAGYFHTKYLTSQALALTGSGSNFLVLPRGLGEETLTLYYVKKPNTIANGNSYVDAPNGVARWAMIYKLMEYIFDTRGEDELADRAARKAEQKMKHFASMQSTVDVSPIQGAQFDYDGI